MKTRLFITIVAFFTFLGAFAQLSKDVKAFANSYDAYMNDNLEEAINTIGMVYDSTSYIMNLRLGWLYYESTNFDESMEYYQRAIDLQPKSIEAKFGKAYPLSALDKWNEIIKLYKEILIIDPGNYNANLRLAGIYKTRNEFDTSIIYAKKLGEYYPFDFVVNLMLAELNDKLNNTRLAKMHLNRALSYNPTSKEALRIRENLR